MRPIIRTPTPALPDMDPQLIVGILAHLLDLWETGQKLDEQLRKLKELRLPQDQEALRSALLWIEAIQVDMAFYWIGEVKKDLPKLLKALDRLERRSVPGKQKQRLQNARPKHKVKRSRPEAEDWRLKTDE